jgi:hypothetical protein
MKSALVPVLALFLAYSSARADVVITNCKLEKMSVKILENDSNGLVAELKIGRKSAWKSIISS